jgi:hypothetical protein
MPSSKKKRGRAATPSAAGQQPAGQQPAGQQPAGDQLVMAAQEGDGAAVARLLAVGADPNASVVGRTPSGEMIQTTPRPGPPGRLSALGVFHSKSGF